jgi:hypothetical protein
MKSANDHEIDWKAFRFPTRPIGQEHISVISPSDILSRAMDCEDSGEDEDSGDGDGAGEGEGSASQGAASIAPVNQPPQPRPAWAIPPHKVGLWMCDPEHGCLVHLKLRRRIDLRRFKFVGQVAAFLSAVREHNELDPASLAEALADAIWIFQEQSLEEFLQTHPEAEELCWRPLPHPDDDGLLGERKHGFVG